MQLSGISYNTQLGSAIEKTCNRRHDIRFLSTFKLLVGTVAQNVFLPNIKHLLFQSLHGIQEVWSGVFASRGKQSLSIIFDPSIIRVTEHFRNL